MSRDRGPSEYATSDGGVGRFLAFGAVRAPARANDRRAALALSCLDGTGPVRYRELADRCGAADVAFHAVARGVERDAALERADGALARASAVGAALLLIGDTAYPAALLELPDPPPALWVAGDTALLTRRDETAAVVGTRQMSAYGERAARSVTAALAEAGAVVASGMALGVDGAAHAATLAAAGATVAVLGTGVDVPYPSAHRRLYDRLRSEGAVVSEQLPGARGSAGAFPRRNRIIAALARATVVIEAGAKSGALITAGVALDLGRTVAAVPGPIDVPSFAGCNGLLRDGAAVIAEPADAVALVCPTRPRRPSNAAPAGDALEGLSDDERAVWNALAAPHADVDALARAAALSPRACAASLATLEIAGAVETDFAGVIRRR